MKKYRGILELTLIEIEKNDMSTKKITKSMTFFFFFFNEVVNVIKKQKPSRLEKQLRCVVGQKSMPSDEVQYQKWLIFWLPITF